MSRRPSAHRRRAFTRAFTVIELLVVIGIIAVLVTLVTFGIKSVTSGQREKATRVTMENLKNLITEKKVTGGVEQLDAVYPSTTLGTPPNEIVVVSETAPPKFPGDYGPQSDRFPVWGSGSGGTPVPQNATARTQAVVALLRSVPNNKNWIAGLPSDQVWLPKPPEVPAGSTAAQIPLILDAWKNPIIYVPPGGLAGVTVTGNVKSRIADTNTSAASPQATIQSPDGKGFWASAGPDGFFTDPDPAKSIDEREPYGDDNVYSFDQ